MNRDAVPVRVGSCRQSRHRSRLPGHCLLACLLLVAMPWTASSADKDAEVSQDTGAGAAIEAEMAAHEQALGSIERRLEQLQRELGDREQYREALYQELERSERDIASLALAGRQLRAMVAEQHRAIDELEARLAQTRVDLGAARAALAELLRSAYVMGGGDRLRMLLNHEDLTRTDRVFGYYRCIGRARAARVEEVGRLDEELSRLREKEQIEAQRLQRLADRQDQTRQRLADAQQARAAIAADLDGAIAEGRDRFAALDADAQALRTLIERLRRRAQIADEIELSQEGIVARKGALAWPVPNATLLSRFRGAVSGQDLHADGVLIAAEEGSEVQAVHHGRVVYADWLRGFGLLLVIDHGEGYMTLYGHNQTLLKEVGEWVATGDVIALTGASGGSGNLGLYFALRRQGAPLDPEQWCLRRQG